jgi:hypothetical protein
MWEILSRETMDVVIIADTNNGIIIINILVAIFVVSQTQILFVTLNIFRLIIH